MTDVKDQSTFLGHDLNANAIASLKPDAAKFNGRANTVFAKVDGVTKMFDEYAASMKPLRGRDETLRRMTGGASKPLRRFWESDPGLSVFLGVLVLVLFVLPPLVEPEGGGPGLALDVGFSALLLAVPGDPARPPRLPGGRQRIRSIDQGRHDMTDTPPPDRTHRRPRV